MGFLPPHQRFGGGGEFPHQILVRGIYFNLSFSTFSVIIETMEIKEQIDQLEKKILQAKDCL